MSDKTGKNNFDLLRFVFASLVILSHSYPLATGSERNEPLILLSGGQLTMGSLSVDCFFIMSGYLIAQSWVRKPLVASYLNKRVRRIYPGYLMAAVISAFIVTPMFSDASFRQLITPQYLQEFLVKAVQLNFHQAGPAFSTNPAPGPVNGSLWSIPFEFWCYIGLMGVGLAGLLKRPLWLGVGLLVLIAIAFVVEFNQLKIGGKIIGKIVGYPTIWAHILPYFVAGMAFFGFRDRIRCHARGAAIAGVLLLLACTVQYALIFVLPFAAAYIVLWLAFIPSRGAHNFARNGDYSFGIYLYAFPITQIIAHYTGPTSPFLLFALAWPASIAAGALSWHFLEHRFMRSHRPVNVPAAVA